MVATLINLTNPDDALNYYEADEYYVGDAKAPSAWHGRGAAKLGLRGEVDPDAFAALLHGELPDGPVLGTVREGVREHKPGWDLTCSAPKSVSVAALVTGDRRLLDAHDRAVRVALDYAERHAATTRIREGKQTPRVATCNLAIATFPHFTARETENLPDPQVHTHCVIINASCDDDGTWRSIESHPIYRLQKAIGAMYHQQLAAEVQRLGYAVTIGGDNGLFELDAIAPEVRDAFANRSHQIEAALAARGQTRATATAAEKAVVALDTRSPKEAVDHQQLTNVWRERAHNIGFTEDVRRAIVANAEARAGQTMPGTRARMRIADREVAFAATHIGERDSVFAAAILERDAGDAARGQVFPSDIVAAIARAEHAQDLVFRAAPGMARGVIGYTTRDAIATEKRMLGLERAGRGTLDPLADHFDAANIVARAETMSAKAGHTWTEGQRAATKALLLSTSSVVGIQGSAGTAKTTTVLRVHADAAKARGYTVRSLAPTATAADALTAEQVAAHAWSPLLHWIKETPRYRLNGLGVMELKVKPRDIMHASHRDACILAKYSHELIGRLDEWYAENGLHETVIAYRSLGKSNYHFAATAQAYVREHQSVEAMCFDVTGFFDNIDHKRLKLRLKWLLGVDELPDDWHRMLRAVTRYSHVRKSDLKAHPVFGERMKQRGADRPLATVKELKAAGIAIRPNPNTFGVPQGTPISASLSNLYLADFDLAMKALADQRGALYQRYSDDILIVCEPEHADDLAAAVEAALKKEALDLHADKTVRVCFTGNERDNFQYLGYQLGLGSALIRPGSLSRQWRSTKRAIRRSERKAEKLAASGDKDKIYTSKLRGRLTHVGLRNFLAYADRSSNELESQVIKQQVKALGKYALQGLARVKAIKNS